MKSRFSTDIFILPEEESSYSFRSLMSIFPPEILQNAAHRVLSPSLHLAPDSPPSPRHPGVWPSGRRSGPGRSKGWSNWTSEKSDRQGGGGDHKRFEHNEGHRMHTSVCYSRWTQAGVQQGLGQAGNGPMTEPSEPSLKVSVVLVETGESKGWNISVLSPCITKYTASFAIRKEKLCRVAFVYRTDSGDMCTRWRRAEGTSPSLVLTVSPVLSKSSGLKCPLAEKPCLLPAGSYGSLYSREKVSMAHKIHIK